MIVLPVERHTEMPKPRFLPNPGDPDRDRQELSLAALPNAAGAARRFVVAQLRKWALDHLDGLVDACELVASELVTNSICETGSLTTPHGYAALHGRTPPIIIVGLRLTRHRLVCEVWDNSPKPPVPSVPGLDDERGRGLPLVAAFATDWGSYPSPGPAGGKVVLAWWDLHTLTNSTGPIE